MSLQLSTLVSRILNTTRSRTRAVGFPSDPPHPHPTPTPPCISLLPPLLSLPLSVRSCVTYDCSLLSQPGLPWKQNPRSSHDKKRLNTSEACSEACTTCTAVSLTDKARQAKTMWVSWSSPPPSRPNQPLTHSRRLISPIMSQSSS